MNALIKRKEIAQLTGWSVRTITRHEKRLKLDGARVYLGTRSVWFCRAKVKRILAAILPE